MDDDSLREALRSLPRVGASRGFTERLVAQTAKAAEPAAPWLARTRVAFAAMFIVVAAGAVTAIQTWRHQQRIDRLRVEHAALTRELDDLRRQTADASPRVYVGGSEDMDFVLDLRERPARGGQDDASGRPFALSSRAAAGGWEAQGVSPSRDAGKGRTAPAAARPARSVTYTVSDGSV